MSRKPEAESGSEQRYLSRRAFLKTMGIVSAGAVLAACGVKPGGPDATPTSPVKPDGSSTPGGPDASPTVKATNAPTQTETATDQPTKQATEKPEPSETATPEIDPVAEISREASAFFKSEGKYTDDAMHDFVQQGNTGDRELGVLDEYNLMSYFQGVPLGYIEKGVNTYLYLGSKDKQGRRIIFVANVFTDNLGALEKAQLFLVTPTQSNAIPQNITLDNSFSLTTKAELGGLLSERIGKGITIMVWTALFDKLPADQASVIERIKGQMGVDEFNRWHDRIEAQKETAIELTQYLFRATRDNVQNIPKHNGYGGIAFTSFERLSFGVDNFSTSLLPMVSGIVYRVK